MYQKLSLYDQVAFFPNFILTSPRVKHRSLTCHVSDRTGTQTVINHNPIPDVAHDEFFRIVGPLLYSTLTNGAETPKYNQPPPSPAIDWFHFEGRNPHATAENLQGLDGWLREREWRHRVVLSVEIGRPGRLGQEMVCPRLSLLLPVIRSTLSLYIANTASRRDILLVSSNYQRHL